MMAEELVLELPLDDLPPDDHGWTKRHAAIVSLVACGFTNAEIGKRLYIEANTVKSHLITMSKRYGARNRAHLVFLAMRAGVIR